MLCYHPALDEFHATLRIISLLAHFPERTAEIERVRLLGFYLLFPDQLRSLRVPPDLSAKKRLVARSENPYFISSTPRIAYTHASSSIDRGVAILISRDILDFGSFRSGLLALRNDKMSPELAAVVERYGCSISVLLEFLVREIAAFPTHGKNGLRGRAGFIETRYDSSI